MNLLIIAALVAVCGAAKLDRTYLPPASARTAGGSPGSLQTPNSFSQNSAPKGSYTNDFQGVVVDAALAGTRASGPEESGLGAPRNSYGFTASKVGEAAFRGAPPQAGFRFPVTRFSSGSEQSQFGEPREIPEHSQSFGVSSDSNQGSGVSVDSNEGFEVDSRPERPQAAEERAANTLRFDSEVGVESFNYAFETDNGISAEETGVATNGVKAQGGYSYTGDDGKVYTVTYTADERGYQPSGDHLPTPPPIPEEILKSLKQNAMDEANGVVDDGSYDAQKYNEGDYAESDSANGKQNVRPSVNTGNDVDASGSFINQKNLPFNQNNPNRGGDKAVSQLQANNGFKSSASNRFGSNNEYLPPFQQNRPQIPRQHDPSTDNGDADSASTFQQESTEGSGDFHYHSQHSQQNQHASRPNTQFSSKPNSNNQQVNGFKQSSSSNQFNQNRNSFPSSQSNRQQLGAAPVGSPSNNGRSQFATQASASLSSQHSTSIPDTELTTPLESSPQDAQPSVSSIDTFGPKAQSTSNGQSHFSSPSSRYQTSQAAAQPTIPSFTQSRPQGPSNNQNRPFGGNRNTQSAFSTQAPRQQEQFAQQSAFGQQTIGTKRPQFSQNTVPQTTDNQFAPSTQKPQFAQQPTSQDDSYYYNQPSRSFNTPQSQGSRFSSAPSNQFNRVTQRPFSSQTTQYPKEENYHSTSFPSQNIQRQGSSSYPRPSSFPTESTPSDNKFQSNAVSSATNGITQASASSFPAPTSATGFNRQQSSQSRQQFQQSSFQANRPSLQKASQPSFVAQTTAQTQTSRGQIQFEKQNFESAQPLSQQPLQDVKQPKLDDDTKSDAPITNQQYNGEIYEYTKPAEMLPPPENGFGQFGTKMPSTPKPAPRTQFGQSATAQQATSEKFSAQPTQFSQSAQAPQSQFGPQFSPTTTQSQQSASSFGSKPQFGQVSNTQADQFGAQTQVSTEADKPGRQQFNQTPKQHNQFNNQRRPSAHSQANFAAAETKPYDQNGSTCCKLGAQGTQQTSFGGRPSQSGGESSFGSTFQSNAAFKPDQSQSVAGKGEVFGGPRAPPRFDETGYHY